MEPVNESILVGVSIMIALYIPVTMSLFREIKRKRKHGIIFDVFMLLLITFNIVFFISMQE